ncbi:branched-chain amino acid ABC transporter permease [Pseudogemmobacter faecipullorum]|uniref:Branched-chain amino acid ABC transporter permease n=1 Tax=Pseudogemmobacter faecipullorum TaxID=2755041 RepID=A0ABS8CNH3_9RHOB|nr:branched-chain amino acid ABC transporter permease [Pseudogemmobacter faecipullorum]MCB5410956.1 branched-chain amino acid ABC transporter permease [Pseudogemmobacter faecipullorum]
MTRLSATNRIAAGIFALFLILPLFGLADYWLYTITIGFYYALLASSWSLLVGYVGRISFAQAAMSGFGAYVALLTAGHFGLSPLPGILLGALAAAGFGVVIGVLTLRLHGAYLGLTTIAFAEILRITATAEHKLTMGTRGLPAPPLWEGITQLGYYYVFLGVLLASLGLMILLLRSRIGLFFQAIREDEDGAASLGVRVTLWKVLAFALSTGFAGLAGGFYAHFIQLIAPSMMSMQEMGYILSMAVIGGFSNIIYAALGGILLQGLLEALREIGEWRLVIFGLIAILVLRFAPNGIFGSLEKWLGRRKN